MAEQGQTLGSSLIIVDANILVYRIVEGQKTLMALAVQEMDPDWKVSPLWKYEFGNALALMIHQGHLTAKVAAQLLETGLKAFESCEVQADPDLALSLSVEKKISFYDAQYLALAKSLGVPLVTEDKGLRRVGTGMAVSMEEFLN